MASTNNEESADVEADDSHGIFKYIQDKWNKLWSWRNPGLYDDIKAETGRNFNNNEPLDGNSNINFRFSDGSTPLTRALKSHDQTAVQELVNTPGIDLEFPEKLEPGLGCVYNAPSCPPLIVAVKSGSVRLAHTLLEAGANINSTDGENCTALYHGVNNSDTEMTRQLLQYNPALECPDGPNDPIHVACKHGNFEIVKMLVEAGCSVTPDNANRLVSPLQHAIGNSSEDICLYLLSYSAENNNKRKGDTDSQHFLLACNMGLHKVVDVCIAKKCDVNMTSLDGSTALMLSTKLYNYLSQRSLLFQPQDVRCDMTCLPSDAREIYHRRVRVVSRLCESGCSLDSITVVNSVHVTALILALKAYNLPAVVLLLKHGAKWDTECQKEFVQMYRELRRSDKICSPNLFILNRYIPKILQMINHKYRVQFQGETNGKFTVPDLKDLCRHLATKF